MMNNAEHSTAQALQDWLYQQAFPRWAQAGVDAEAGGFWEGLGPNGPDQSSHVTDRSRKRLRSQMRQIYAFTAAHRLGWQGPALDIARQGVDFVLNHYQHGDGGWSFACDATGHQIDHRRDFYELAFVIFGMGHYYKESRDPRALDAARQTIDWLNECLRDRKNGGWFSGIDADGSMRQDIREQNPHMHLFEALILLFRVFPEAVPDWMCQELLWLAETRFVDDQGWLREQFTSDWTIADGDKGALAEPGHLFEWVWILQQAAGLMEPVRCQRLATKLYDAAMSAETGFDGLIPDQVRVPGPENMVNPAYRLWPQTEVIKAHLAMVRFGKRDAATMADQAMQRLLDRYLIPAATSGCWHEHLGADATSQRPDSPATSFYHILVAAEDYLASQNMLTKY